MRCKFVLLLLVMAAFWQTIAIGGQVRAYGNPEDLTHAMLHWEGRAHHHHADGSVTQDDSSESVQHVVADACLSAPAVWSAVCVFLPSFEAARPVAADESFGLGPHLAGPRRPPRLMT
jgi:hypothetical protein